MSLSDTFIRRPVLSTVCSILILMAGVIALPLLPIENLPNIAPPTIQVTANLPGADALTVESAVTGPLEEQINGAPGMDYISSNSTSQGVSQINVVFKAGTDPDIDQVNVLNRVQTASAQLPEQVNSQGVTVQQTATSYLLVYNLTSTEGQFSRDYLNGLYQLNLAYPISRAEGVGQVTVFGASDPAYKLWVDPQKLTRFNLTILDVENALRSQNQIVVAGSIGGPPASPNNPTNLPILVQGNLRTVEEFEDLVLTRGASATVSDSGPDGSLIRLRDVGRAEYAFQNFNQAAINGISGHPCVGFGVIQLPGSNAISTAKAVDAVLDQFRSTLPPGVRLEKVFDQTDFINASIFGALDALRDAVVLVLLIIFLFLQDWKATMVPALALPIALLGAMIFVKAFGFSINELTLLGVILATGLVVDDAIVVIEAVAKNLENGMRPRQAALACMGELIGALIATSLVLMAVFVPVAFYPGGIGIIYRQFALTIAFAIAISTFNALTFSPMMAGLILKAQKPPKPKGWGWSIGGIVVGLAFGRFSAASFGIGAYVVGVLAFGLAGSRLALIFERFNTFFTRLEQAYVRLVAFLITKRKLILAGLGGGIVLTAIAFSALPTAFIPE